MSKKLIIGSLFVAVMTVSLPSRAQDSTQTPVPDLRVMLGPSIGLDAARASAAPVHRRSGVGVTPGNVRSAEDSGAVLPLGTSPRDVTENIGLNAVHDMLTPNVTRKGRAF